tara:strand:+ start:129 stop:266 length:138 start_codon:yes stop_codon:yes gene_type:complete
LYDHDKIWSLIIIKGKTIAINKQMEGSDNPNKIEANLNFGMSTAK